MCYPIDKITAEMQQINFQGNIIPASWKHHLTLSGRVDLNSMWVLSEIVFWYRPICLRDEEGKEVYYRKYQADLLQKSYSQLEKSLGLSKKQIQDSLERLEKQGLVKRHFRTIQAYIPNSTDTRPMSNVMFIQIFPEKIKEITYSELKKVIRYTPTGDKGSSPESIGVIPQVSTYTETTPKITSQKKTTTKKEGSSSFSINRNLEQLEQLPLTVEQKNQIYKDFDDFTIFQAVYVYLARKTQPDDLGAFIYSACKRKWKKSQSKEQLFASNRSLADQSIRKWDDMKERNGYRVTVLSKHVEFISGQRVDCINYEDPDFKNKLKALAIKVDPSFKL